jgi:hypothetical protein
VENKHDHVNALELRPHFCEGCFSIILTSGNLDPMTSTKKNPILDGIFARMNENGIEGEAGILRGRLTNEPEFRAEAGDSASRLSAAGADRRAKSEAGGRFAGRTAGSETDNETRQTISETEAPGAVADFEHVAQSVRLASMVLKDLVRKNEQISSASAEKIDELGRQLVSEQERSAEIQRQLDEAVEDKRRIASESVRRIRELETLASEFGEKLAKCTQELEISKQWLDHLRSEVDRELNNTLVDVEKVLAR